MLNVIIVDDEPLARDLLVRWLAELESVHVSGVASTLDNATKLLEQNNIDAVFLDINLAGENGFGLIDRFDQQTPPDIVFVTAYSEYAIDAFRVNAVDYLKKPFNRNHLRDAVERIKRRRFPELGETSQTGLLGIKEGHQTVFIEIPTIISIQSAGGYSVINTNTHRHITRTTLAKISQELGPSFVRVHRSTIINVDYLKRITPLKHGDSLLTLQDDSEIRLSRRYRESLLHIKTV